MEGLHAQGGVGQVGDQVFGDVLQRVGAGGDVGGAGLDGGHGGRALLPLIQGYVAHDDVRLGGIVGDGEVQLVDVGLYVVVGGAVAVDVAVVPEAVAVASIFPSVQKSGPGLSHPGQWWARRQ